MPVNNDRKVLVMILKNSKYESKSSSIRRAFHNYMFEVHHVSSGDKKKKRDCDLYLEALEEARKISPSSHVILISDCMITVAPPSTITNTIKRLLREPDADFIYLNRYNDKCQMMSPLNNKCDCNDDRNRGLPNINCDHDRHHEHGYDSDSERGCECDRNNKNGCSCGIRVVKTRSPNGNDCIMFSPHGRDIVLGKSHMNNKSKLNIKNNISDALNRAIEKGHVSAIAATPNLFEYDIVDNATDNCHYDRRCECAPLQLLADPVEERSGSANLLLLIFIVFIILAVAWALINIGPK